MHQNSGYVGIVPIGFEHDAVLLITHNDSYELKIMK
jgi:hypothetical protein